MEDAQDLEMDAVNDGGYDWVSLFLDESVLLNEPAGSPFPLPLEAECNGSEISPTYSIMDEGDLDGAGTPLFDVSNLSLIPGSSVTDSGGGRSNELAGSCEGLTSDMPPEEAWDTENDFDPVILMIDGTNDLPTAISGGEHSGHSQVGSEATDSPLSEPDQMNAQFGLQLHDLKPHQHQSMEVQCQQPIVWNDGHLQANPCRAIETQNAHDILDGQLEVANLRAEDDMVNGESEQAKPRAGIVEGGGETCSLKEVGVMSEGFLASSSSSLGPDTAANSVGAPAKGPRRGHSRKLQNSEGQTEQRERSSTSLKMEGGSDGSMEDAPSDQSEGGCGTCEDAVEAEKRQARLMRNRESAQLSRQRKKVYVDELEEKLRSLNATVTQLQATIAHLTQENVAFRRQLGYYCSPALGPGGRPIVGIPPYGVPMRPGFPVVVPGLMPGAPAPPVPIPRLKPAVSTVAKASKASSRPKAGSASPDGPPRKRARAAAGSAGAAVLALFCCAMILGPLSPHLSINSLRRTSTSINFSSGRTLGQNHATAGGRVLMGISDSDAWTNSSEFSEGKRPHSKEGFELGSDWDRRAGMRLMLTKGGIRDRVRGGGAERRGHVAGGRGRQRMMNVTQLGSPVATSLVVRRSNNELVRIDGDLIIHAVMAGDKAAAEAAAVVEKGSEGEGKVGAQKDVAEVKSVVERWRAQEMNRAAGGPLMGSELGPADLGERRALPWATMAQDVPTVEGGEERRGRGGGRREVAGEDLFFGLGGPVLSSGMCTEVFQFDMGSDRSGRGARAAAAAAAAAVAVPGEEEEVEQGGVEVGEVNASSPAPRAYRNGARVVPSRKFRPFAVPLLPAKGKEATGIEVNETGIEVNETRGVGEGADGRKGRERTLREVAPSEACGRAGGHPSTMVVSVLASPDEGTVGGLSRIFVVVLVGGTKYVTYSCMMPSAVRSVGRTAHVAQM